PARIGKATIVDSLVTNGCVIDGDAIVERSVLSPGVRVGRGAVVRESIVLNDCVIGKGAVVERAIIDKGAVIGAGARVGAMEAVLPPQLSVVGKGSTLPEGFVVRPAGEVAHDVVPADLEGTEIPSGLSVYTKRRPWDVKP